MARISLKLRGAFHCQFCRLKQQNRWIKSTHVLPCDHQPSECGWRVKPGFVQVLGVAYSCSDSCRADIRSLSQEERVCSYKAELLTLNWQQVCSNRTERKQGLVYDSPPWWMVSLRPHRGALGCECHWRGLILPRSTIRWSPGSPSSRSLFLVR